MQSPPRPSPELYAALLKAAGTPLGITKEGQWVKPIRRLKHALGLKGRQWKALYKQSRHLWKASTSPTLAAPTADTFGAPSALSPAP